jgi:hypothetical protein
MVTLTESSVSPPQLGPPPVPLLDEVVLAEELEDDDELDVMGLTDPPAPPPPCARDSIPSSVVRAPHPDEAIAIATAADTPSARFRERKGVFIKEEFEPNESCCRAYAEAESDDSQRTKIFRPSASGAIVVHSFR